MGFIGKQPTPAPLTASDIPDLPATKITSGTFPALNGSNLTSLPAGNLTGTLPAISGANLTGITSGGLVFLQGQDASGTQSVTVGSSSLFSSTYKIYLIQGSNIRISGDGNQVHCRYTLSSGTKSDAYYRYVRKRMYSGSTAVSGYAANTNTSIPHIAESLGTSAGENGYFSMYVYNPSETSYYKTVQIISGGQDLDRNQQQNVISGTYTANTEAIHGVYIYTNSGTITSGRFNLYGLANA